MNAAADVVSSGAGRRTRTGRLTLLLSCGAAGAVIFNAAYLVNGALHGGYDPVRDTISSLELVSDGWVQQANFILFGALTVLFGMGMWVELAGGIAGLLYPVLRWTAALGLFVSGFFVHDPLHTTGDVVTFLSSAIGLLVIAGRLAGDRRWRGWTAYSIASALLTVALIAAFGATLRRGGPAGLLERVASGVPTLWAVLFWARLVVAGARVPTGKRAESVTPGRSVRPPRENRGPAGR